MNATAPNRASAALPVPEFGQNADGLTVARIGDAAYAMIPKREAGYFLGSGWRLSKPFADWKRSDFYGHGGDIADEATFRAFVQEQAEHQAEKATLGRQEFRAHASTPWGPSQGAVGYGEGVVFHSTSGHGGFHLSAERNAKVHPLLRDGAGYYEEDAAWAAVATAWPDLFTGLERRQAEETLRHNSPDAWEAIQGRKLRPGESRTRDAEAFARDHAQGWVVTSAIYSDHQPGFTEVVATRGGRRDRQAEERRFLVPSAEYKVGPFGFIIDAAHHAVYDGPSRLHWLAGQVRGLNECSVPGSTAGCPTGGRGGSWFRDGFQGVRESPTARRGVIPMTFPLPQSAFRAPRDILVRDTLAHLRLADRLPLRIHCLCLAHWEDPALDQLQIEREVELGTFGSLAGAMAEVVSAIASGHIAADHDPKLRLAPQFASILDAEGRLVLTGVVRSGGVRWCDPVRSDAEARQVVGDACRLRADARNAEFTGDAARVEALRTQARALEGRLVDPLWRDLARGAVDQTLAA